jgi:hypothetical protein
MRFAQPVDSGLEAFNGAVLAGDMVEQEASWRAFKILEALSGPYGEYLFLPSQVLAEPQVILDNVLLLRAYLHQGKKVWK